MFATLRQRDFVLLWLAGLVSIAGDLAFVIALPLHVYRLTDSTLATAATFAASSLPGVLFGSVAGVFVDRWDRKRTMILADLLRAVLLMPLLIAPDQLGMIYTIAIIQGAVGLFFSPAESALLPKLVEKERLVTANALNSLNDNIAFLVGPALGSLLYATSGIGGVTIINAVTYLGSAALIRGIVADGRPERGESSSSQGDNAWLRVYREWIEGLRFVFHDRALRVLFVSVSLAGVAEGIFVTLALAPFVLDVLEGRPVQVGWMGTAQAVGGLIASLVVIRFGHRLSRRWLFGGGMAGLGLADFSAFNSRRVAGPGNPAVAVAMGWMVVAGVPAVANGTGQQTIVQEQSNDAFRGRVFGALRAVTGIFMLIGFAAGGVLGERVGLVLVLSSGALLRVAGGVIAMIFLPRDERPIT